MTGSNDTSRLVTLEDHDTLEDTELCAVTGGQYVTLPKPVGGILLATAVVAV